MSKSVIAVIVIALFTASPVFAKNLLNNSGFDKADANGMPADWEHAVGLEGTQVKIKLWGDAQPGDTSCLRSDSSHLSAEKVETYKRAVPVVEQKTTLVVPGKSYRLSILAKPEYAGDDDSEMRFKLRAQGLVKTKAGDELETVATPVGKSAGQGEFRLTPFCVEDTFEIKGKDWKRFEITFQVPQEGWCGELTVNVQVLWRGVVYFDDFELTCLDDDDPNLTRKNEPDEEEKIKKIDDSKKPKIEVKAEDPNENDDDIGALLGHGRRKQSPDEQRKEAELREKARQEAEQKKVEEKKPEPEQKKDDAEDNSDTIKDFLGHGKRKDR